MDTWFQRVFVSKNHTPTSWRGIQKWWQEKILGFGFLAAHSEAPLFPFVGLKFSSVPAPIQIESIEFVESTNTPTNERGLNCKAGHPYIFNLYPAFQDPYIL